MYRGTRDHNYWFVFQRYNLIIIIGKANQFVRGSVDCLSHFALICRKELLADRRQSQAMQ